MKIKILKIIRTNNFLDKLNQEKIKEVFMHAYNYAFENSINNKLVGVYSNYENNYKGDYDYSSGYIIEDGSDEVWDLELNDNDGSDSQFIVYSTKVTEENFEIASLWEKIWNLEENNEITRKYTTDIDLFKDWIYYVYLAVTKNN